MNRRPLQQLVGCFVAAVQASGCYADSVTAPEPTLTTPGAFIAVPFEPVLPGGAAGEAGHAGQSGTTDGLPDADGAGGGAMDGDLYRMIRVVAVFDVTSDLAIFHLQYGVVESLEEAREATKVHPDGPPPPVSITSLGRLEAVEAVVVGYRSLTEEEQAVIQ